MAKEKRMKKFIKALFLACVIFDGTAILINIWIPVFTDYFGKILFSFLGLIILTYAISKKNLVDEVVDDVTRF